MKRVSVRAGFGLVGLPFGATSEAVGLEFGESPRVIDRFGIRRDRFLSGVVTVHYDRGGAFEAVEFQMGTTPGRDSNGISGSDVVADFDGELIHPLKISASELLDWAALRDPDVVVDDTGFTSKTLGFGAYADWLKKPERARNNSAPAKSVILFRRGYYDEGRMQDSDKRIQDWMRSIGIDPEPDQ